MSRPKWISAIGVSGLMVVVGAVAWAQGQDRDACVDVCRQLKGVPEQVVGRDEFL